ncbi:endonuclease/exonuclease/phosphatase family protein [Peptacetobacter sp.]|uniref:endonuclease/exonuclease/phosphatase family protein n=1 Tax=Peptacetobacter sp. TaxID=2991975 RepID=UPI00261DE283|nr:endonuclease/exonuclease/phosphatase family protein [Peptacetobacter sp.]
MKKVLKKIGKYLSIIVGVIALFLIIYLGWLTISDYKPLTVENISMANNKIKKELDIDKEYSISTYNIGFGAYNQEFDFFMDGGTKSKAKDRKTVLENIEGSINTIKSINPDFSFIQEIDINSSRSRKTDQRKLISNGLGNNYTNSFAYNYKVPYIIYPFNDMHGKVCAGQATYSKYGFESAERITLPTNQKWPDRLFGLDRCMIINRLKTKNNKELVLINLHMSAYDKNGEYRQKQLKVLSDLLEKEYQKGNYVLAGGDWNHIIPITDINKFAKKEAKPDWYSYIPKSFNPKGFRIEVDKNISTNRTAGIPYDKDINYTGIIDGFIVSDNIYVTSKKGYNTEFKYSDHNPTMIKFKFKN